MYNPQYSYLIYKQLSNNLIHLNKEPGVPVVFFQSSKLYHAYINDSQNVFDLLAIRTKQLYARYYYRLV